MWNVFILFLFMHVLCQKWRNKTLIYTTVSEGALQYGQIFHETLVLIEAMTYFILLPGIGVTEIA